MVYISTSFLKKRTLFKWPILWKSGFVLLISLILFYELTVRREWSDVYAIFTGAIHHDQVLYLCIVIALMPFNWVLEAMKWRITINNAAPITILQSLKVIVVGISFGIATPSRIGEYGGRFYMMPKGLKWNSISATLIGSIAQNIITASVGLMGAYYLISNGSALGKYIYSAMLYLLIIIISIGLWIYYHPIYIAKIAGMFSRVKWMVKIEKSSTFLKDLIRRDLHTILSFSLVRYSIYSTQYFLLLSFFGIELAWWEASAIIAFLFLIQAGLPLPPLLGVMARGELAITLWSLYTDNTLGIIATTFLLWMINLMVPVLIGLVLILRKKDS